MNTPIFDFVQNYIKSNTARLHMPGHKGVSYLGLEAYDITEIAGADELFSQNGIIKKSEENASKLFGTQATFYSADGSTQTINAMLYLALLNSKGGKTVIAGRNAHKAFICGCAKLDLTVHWLYPENKSNFCSCAVSAHSLEREILNLSEKPIAVYITSPDYLGTVTDIKSISEVCRKYEIPLLVDNAHGAYTAFLRESQHPMHLGADMCCDSAHKTLPVLTGGGYLHIAKGDLYGFSQNAVRAMEFFCSTSPSYLILQSLDLCNKYLFENAANDFRRCVSKAADIKKIMSEIGIDDISSEPLKITADFSGLQCLDGSFSDHFRKNGIEFEYSDGDYIVFMLSPQNSEEDFGKLKEAFRTLPKFTSKIPDIMFPVKGESVMSIREAMLKPFETVPVDCAEGRICSVPSVSCPPAIPIAISGEIITKEHIRLFKRYGKDEISVVK